MSIKGFMQLNEEILPFSRNYIADKLVEISNYPVELSSIEQEELEFYFREFSAELERKEFDLTHYKDDEGDLSFFGGLIGVDKYNRFRLLNYNTEDFSLFMDPIAGYNYELSRGENSVLWSNGLKVYGSISSSIGFDLQFYDNHLRGDYFDGQRNFSPETGFEFDVGKGGGKDFDRMNANLNFSWK